MSSFPKIIYGTAWKKERTKALVIQAVQQGFRAIDTACQPRHYDEGLVGEALDILEEQHGIRRSDLFIQTKYTSIDGQDRTQPLPYDPSTSIAAQVQSSFAKSLLNLRVDKINGYLLHGPLRTKSLTLEAWDAIVDLKRTGKVDLVGVSNIYDVKTLEFLTESSGTRPDIVQNRWYEGNGWDTEVVAYCLKHGVHYESFWTLSGSPSLLAHPPLQQLAGKLGCTPEQAVYRVAQHIGITPLAGSTNEQHMKDGVETEGLDLADQEGLVNEVVQALASSEE